MCLQTCMHMVCTFLRCSLSFCRRRGLNCSVRSCRQNYIEWKDLLYLAHSAWKWTLFLYTLMADGGVVLGVIRPRGLDTGLLAVCTPLEALTLFFTVRSLMAGDVVVPCALLHAKYVISFSGVDGGGTEALLSSSKLFFFCYCELLMASGVVVCTLRTPRTLHYSLQVLTAAEARLSSKRCVGITTSSDKFQWSRAVQKFVQAGAHPGKNPGIHREQEAVLRRDQVPWKPAEVEVRGARSKVSLRLALCRWE